VDPSSQAYDEALVLADFAHTLETQPHLASEPNGTPCLSEDRIRYFYKKFPLGSFKRTSEWGQAVVKDMRTVLLPALESDSPDQRELAQLMRSARTFTVDLLERELVPEERLDAMMDRAVKRLLQSKVAKTMIAQSWQDGRSVQLQLPATQIRECAKTTGSVRRLKAASLSIARPEFGDPTMLSAAA
jgi:hypothetical protein